MENLKKIIKTYNETSLILRIVAGLVIGILVGIFAPGMEWLKFIGDIFVGALKSIAPVLVFILVASSLCQGSGKSRT